jgi:polysaccharide export outer membrane protein
MILRGKLKRVATLAALLGMCLITVGCLVSEPSTTGPASTSYQPGNGSNGAAANTPYGASHANSNNPIQQASYQAPADTKIQPMPMPQGPGCSGPGCAGARNGDFGPGPIPTEINLVSLPPYVVAPPDILFIDASRLVPKPPYKIEPLDVLLIQVTDTLPQQPINGPFVVTPEGNISLGYGYGNVHVQGLTIEQIQAAVRAQLANVLRSPQVSVSLAQFRGMQQTKGEHLVRPDGTISLGTYGSIYVAGMTLGQVKCAIEQHLSQFVISPQVAVDVYAYNSMWYYVIFDGGGYGEQVYRLPITGNETVLDAISNLQGLPAQASTWRIWVARPAPCGHACDQILMVDWEAVTKGGSTCTNYQLMPNDRVYVDADCLVKTDLWLAKILAPVNRVLGTALLGASTYWTFRENPNNNNNNGGFIVP